MSYTVVLLKTSLQLVSVEADSLTKAVSKVLQNPQDYFNEEVADTRYSSDIDVAGAFTKINVQNQLISILNRIPSLKENQHEN